MAAMAATPSKPFVLVRRTLLLAFFAFLVIVAATYVLRQRSRSSVPQPTRSTMDEAEPHLVLTGEGFDYALTEEGKKLFHIRAKRILSEGEDDYVLEEVEIEITRDDGGVYQVEGGRAEVNLATNRAILEGGVRFHGPRGLEMTTEGLEVRRRGNLMVSSAPVEFGFLGRFTGRADHLRANARKNNFVLAGEVTIDTFPGDEVPMSVRSRRLVYDRDIKLVRLEGNVELRRAGSEIRARRLALKLTEDENTLAFARAYWDVEGRLEQETSEGVPRAVEISGNELSIIFVEGTDQPLKAELEGDGTRLAMLTFDDGLGLKQRIQSDYLLADFDQGSPRLTQAFDRVQIDEFIALAPEPVLRRICADSAEASILASGEIDEVRLLGDVEGCGGPGWRELRPWRSGARRSRRRRRSRAGGRSGPGLEPPGTPRGAADHPQPRQGRDSRWRAGQRSGRGSRPALSNRPRERQRADPGTGSRGDLVGGLGDGSLSRRRAGLAGRELHGGR
jgi:LPS export ABC transporter protein LptC